MEKRWIQKAETIPWFAVEDRYVKLFPSKKGMPAKPLRMAPESLIIQKNTDTPIVNWWNRSWKIHRPEARFVCRSLQ